MPAPTMSLRVAEGVVRRQRLRAQEAAARPTLAIEIGHALRVALGAPQLPGPIAHAVPTALQVAGAGFAVTLALHEKAAHPVVHDQLRRALAGPVEAVLIGAPPEGLAIMAIAAARGGD